MDKNKKLYIKITSGVLAVCTLVTMGYVLVKERNKKIVKDANFGEIYEYCINNDTNRRDISEEMYNDLELVERYLNASNNINNIYEQYKEQISNLELGTVKQINNEIIFMTDEEFNLLENNIALVMDPASQLTYDERMQLVGKIISNSANVNVFLYFKGYEILRQWLSISIADDAAIVIGVDNNIVNCKIEDKNMYVSRRDDDNGYSYDVECSGTVNNKLMDNLLIIESHINTGNSFLNGEINSITYGKDNAQIIYFEENNNLCASYNSSINKEINNYLNEIKYLLFRDVEIRDGKIKYDYYAKDSITNGFKDSKNKVLSKG